MEGIVFSNPRRKVGPLTLPKNQNKKAWNAAREAEALEEAKKQPTLTGRPVQAWWTTLFKKQEGGKTRRARAYRKRHTRRHLRK